MFRWTYTIAAIMVISLFYVFAITSNPIILGLATYVLLLYAAFGNATLSVAFLEFTPDDARVTGFSFTYQITTGIYGGFIP